MMAENQIKKHNDVTNIVTIYGWINLQISFANINIDDNVFTLKVKEKKLIIITNISVYKTL